MPQTQSTDNNYSDENNRYPCSENYVKNNNKLDAYYKFYYNEDENE